MPFEKNCSKSWQGKLRIRMNHDYDQAAFLMGSCFEGSGINTSDTLNNPNFIPRKSVEDILEWFSDHGHNAEIRNAAIRALRLYRSWEARQKQGQEQMGLPMG